MKDSPSPTGNIVTSLIFFGVTAAIAIILFIDAFVMWLASLTGSVAVAALITGGFFAVIAAVVYLLAVRSALNYVRDRIETVYEVASRIKEGYDWLSDKFSFLSFLRRSIYVSKKTPVQGIAPAFFRDWTATLQIASPRGHILSYSYPGHAGKVRKRTPGMYCTPKVGHFWGVFYEI